VENSANPFGQHTSKTDDTGPCPVGRIGGRESGFMQQGRLWKTPRTPLTSTQTKADTEPCPIGQTGGPAQLFTQYRTDCGSIRKPS
jgi:hypothetical protein